MKSNPFLIFFKLTRPHFLLGIVGQVFLGAGIAHYMGRKIDWVLFSLGLGWLMSLQLGIHYLIQYFDLIQPMKSNLHKFFSFFRGLLGEKENQLPRSVALVAAAGMFTITTFFTLGFAQFKGLNPVLVVMMGAIFLLSLSYALPSVNLSESGHGEWVIAIIVGILVPGFSFLLQASEPHRLVIIATMPLAVILIPVVLALEFPNYALNLKHQKPNLLMQLGWKSAMSIHNAFILMAFLLQGLTALYGVPLQIALLPLLAFPLGLLQIWQMKRIAAGGKPNWNALTWNAVVIFGLLSYMLVFSFWLS